MFRMFRLSTVADSRSIHDRLNVQAMLDMGSLDLTPNQNLWTGKIESDG